MAAAVKNGIRMRSKLFWTFLPLHRQTVACLYAMLIKTSMLSIEQMPSPFYFVNRHELRLSLRFLAFISTTSTLPTASHEPSVL